MKVIHIESGLGNQMLSYCEYLALKKVNPNEKFYIENIVFDIPECDTAICQWNGYELDSLFGIQEPANIRTLFTAKEWDNIIREIRNSKFWEKNWNYPVYITQALNHAGLSLKNVRGNFENSSIINVSSFKKETFLSKLKETKFAYILRRYYQQLRRNHYIQQKNRKHILFDHSADDLFTGQWLSFKYIGNNRELIDDEIKEAFVFPEFTDKQNKDMSDFLSSVNSVAIHARRGDMLSVNGWCYKYGYFRRAVSYIRRHVDNPVFVFFTNTGSVEWCKENAKTFGLDYSKDKVYFVDWNKDKNSYRDMQLMGYCKHAIITNSTFGWWGAYFITNPQKITISPLVEIDTTVHC